MSQPSRSTEMYAAQLSAMEDFGKSDRKRQTRRTMFIVLVVVPAVIVLGFLGLMLLAAINNGIR